MMMPPSASIAKCSAWARPSHATGDAPSPSGPAATQSRNAWATMQSPAVQMQSLQSYRRPALMMTRKYSS